MLNIHPPVREIKPIFHPKKPFSVFERGILPKVGERERTPFAFCPNPHHVQNPRLGTRFETVCGRFLYKSARVPTLTFEVKADCRARQKCNF